MYALAMVAHTERESSTLLYDTLLVAFSPKTIDDLLCKFLRSIMLAAADPPDWLQRTTKGKLLDRFCSMLQFKAANISCLGRSCLDQCGRFGIPPGWH